MRALLTNSCDVYRWTRATGDDYTFQPVWSLVQSGVPCLIQERAASSTKIVHGDDLQYSAVAYFTASVDIRPAIGDAAEGDRIECSGKTYQVVAILDQAGKGRTKKALLKAV